MGSFKDAQEGYTPAAAVCLARAKAIIEAVRARGEHEKESFADFLAEQLWQYRETVIHEQRESLAREKRAYAEGLKTQLSDTIAKFSL